MSDLPSSSAALTVERVPEDITLIVHYLLEHEPEFGRLHNLQQEVRLLRIRNVDRMR